MFVMEWTVFIIPLLLSTPAYAENATDYRLPANHIPKQYDLGLVIDPDSSEFKGQVNITLSTKIKTNTIKLHASPDFITITSVKLNGSSLCNVSSIDTNTEIATIVCPNAIEISDNNKVIINFDGVFGDDPYCGVFKVNYTYEGKTEYFIATQFEATCTRQSFPVFDEPQLKAAFQVTIIHPKSYSVLFNTRSSSTATYNQ